VIVRPIGDRKLCFRQWVEQRRSTCRRQRAGAPRLRPHVRHVGRRARGSMTRRGIMRATAWSSACATTAAS
jgi:hypothetical protein